jgi:hypothetical protein
VKQDPTPRTRSFIRELVPDLRPTREQKLWASGATIAVVLALAIFGLLGFVLWMVLGIYINPRTATERKDLVQSFAIVVAGVVGSLSALAAVGNLYVSRRNLQQERELELERAERERDLEKQRAQEDALPAYLDQMVQLLNDRDRPLRQSQVGDEVSILGRVRTLTVLPRLDGGRKRSVIQFLYESGLITRDGVIVDLKGADLSGADLSEAADLSGADLSGANLRKATLRRTSVSGGDLSGTNLSESNLSESNLSNANLSWAADLREANLMGTYLRGANMRGADLTGADLSGADLAYANLSEAKVTQEQLEQARFLEGATMPNGQKYEEWLKSQGSEEDGGKE